MLAHFECIIIYYMHKIGPHVFKMSIMYFKIFLHLKLFSKNYLLFIKIKIGKN